MADQIAYKQGDKKHFVAARTFALGSTGMTVPKGADIMFDGTTVEFGGTTFSHPQFRGAVRAGWATLAENYDPDDRSAERPIAANIQVRHPTQGGNPMTGGNRNASAMTPTVTEDDEREVSNVSAHRQATADRNRNHRHGEHIEARPGTSVELQDGVPVRKLKTAAGEKAKQARTVITAETAGSRIREAESPAPIDAGRGMTEEEMLERMAPAQREAYLSEKSALKSRYVDVDTDAQRPVVATLNKSKSSQTTEGVTAKVTTGGGTETWDGAGTGDGGATKVTTTTVDGIKMTNTNGPSNREQPSPRSAEAQKPVMLKDGSADVRLMVAKQLCPDFPSNYDFAANQRKKLARLQADYEDRPDVIRAIFAAESDDFKSVLIREFPQAFGG
jgi:hypothetical protein